MCGRDVGVSGHRIPQNHRADDIPYSEDGYEIEKLHMHSFIHCIHDDRLHLCTCLLSTSCYRG